MTHPLVARAAFALVATAAAIAGVAAHAATPDNPYAPLAYMPMTNHGQALVDMEMAKHPELKILTLHVTPPGVAPGVDAERRLMFSNIGRIGKVDIQTDNDIYNAGKEVVEELKDPAPASTNFSITATPKYEVLVPLEDKAGHKIGLTVMVFPYHATGFDHEAYHAVAKTVAADLKSRIESKDSLFNATTPAAKGLIR